MSISLYYNANRAKAFSEKEQQITNNIIEKYNKAFPLKKDGDDFYVYCYAPNAPESIFSGSLGLPYDPEKAIEATLYWMKCLTELRKYLPDCTWEVSLCESWNKEIGCMRQKWFRIKFYSWRC